MAMADTGGRRRGEEALEKVGAAVVAPGAAGATVERL